MAGSSRHRSKVASVEGCEGFNENNRPSTFHCRVFLFSPSVKADSPPVRERYIVSSSFDKSDNYSNYLDYLRIHTVCPGQQWEPSRCHWHLQSKIFEGCPQNARQKPATSPRPFCKTSYILYRQNYLSE